MKDITEIVKDVIDLLDYKFVCNEVVVNGDNFVLGTCKTYWLRAGKRIVINGFDYEIVSVSINNSITVNPINHIDVPTTGELFDIPKPTYRHGTARAINEELTNMDGKTPFVWLYEVLTEKINKDPLIEVGLECDVRLFLFDDANISDWYTENHYEVVIRPLKELAEQIILVINSDLENFQELLTYSLTYLPNWGEFNGMKGNTVKIFDEQWSGVEMSFTLVVNKSSTCDNCN